MGEKFNPSNMERLLSEERRAYQDPVKVLDYLQLDRCTAMADVGCGPGFFTLEAARAMQPGGLVYGIDVSAQMLERLMQRAGEAGLQNVKPILAEEDDQYPVPTEAVDAVLILNVYHEVDAASNFLGEIKRILRPGGVCLVVDWRPEPTPSGPPQSERLDPQDVTEEFYANGFILEGTCDVGPYHYGLKFEKPGDPRGEK